LIFNIRKVQKIPFLTFRSVTNVEPTAVVFRKNLLLATSMEVELSARHFQSQFHEHILYRCCELSFITRDAGAGQEET